MYMLSHAHSHARAFSCIIYVPFALLFTHAINACLLRRYRTYMLLLRENIEGLHAIEKAMYINALTDF